MRFISTKTHGVLDYTMGIFLIIAPWVLGFADGAFATYIPVALGITVLAYSLMTNYELGLAKFIPMPVHLAVDFVSGLFLAISPWIFGFSDQVYVPHLVLGIFEMGAPLMTEKAPKKYAATSTIHSTTNI